MKMAVQKVFHFVPHSTAIYLLMDNTGTKKTELAKVEYSHILKVD